MALAFIMAKLPPGIDSTAKKVLLPDEKRFKEGCPGAEIHATAANG
jgi:hypothetical protein